MVQAAKQNVLINFHRPCCYFVRRDSLIFAQKHAHLSYGVHVCRGFCEICPMELDGDLEKFDKIFSKFPNENFYSSRKLFESRKILMSLAMRAFIFILTDFFFIKNCIFVILKMRKLKKKNLTKQMFLNPCGGTDLENHRRTFHLPSIFQVFLKMFTLEEFLIRPTYVRSDRIISGRINPQKFKFLLRTLFTRRSQKPNENFKSTLIKPKHEQFRSYHHQYFTFQHFEAFVTIKSWISHNRPTHKDTSVPKIQYQFRQTVPTFHV